MSVGHCKPTVGAKRCPLTGFHEAIHGAAHGSMDCFRLRWLSFGGQVVASLAYATLRLSQAMTAKDLR
jgi:hypothetical protein